MTTPLFPIVVFDLDGTLAETAPDLIDALNATLASEGCAKTRLEDARELVGAGMRALIERALVKQGKSVSDQHLDELFKAFFTHYEKNLCVKTTLYPGVRDALETLKEKNYILAVCTNKPEYLSVMLLEKLGIGSLFSAICGRDTFSFCKPDPRHLWATIEKAGGDKNHAVMVGDSQTDINTAHNAYLPVIAFPFGYSEKPVETFNPTRIIQNYKDLVVTVEELI